MKKLSSVFRKARRGSTPLEYHFLPYVTGVLRVLGWAVLIIGVIGSTVFGVEILERGLMIGQTELLGMGPGVSVIVLGIVCSFLCWLFLLVSRELIYLFIHVKQNTKSTAGHLAKG
jgi:hypothetical protein